MPSPIALEVNGQRFSDWLTASFSFSLDDGASTFQMTVSERWQGTFFRLWEPWQIPVGSEVKVYVHGELVLVGHVDVHESEIGAETHTVSIGGRSKSGDLVDSSLIHDGYRWESQPILGIARDVVAGFGINVDAALDLPTIDSFQVEAGVEAWEVLRQLSERTGALIVPTRDGGVRFERVSNDVLPFELHCFENIRVRNDMTERHSDWVTEGQRHGYDGEGLEAAQVRGETQDSAVKRYRPLLVQAEGENDGTTAQQIAEWRKARSIGGSLSATVTIPDFQNPDGEIWWPNQLLRVRAPRVNLDRQMIIAGVTFDISEGGRACTLELKHPAAYTPKPTRRSVVSGGPRNGSGGSQVSETQPATDAFAAVDDDRSLPGFRLTNDDDGGSIL